MEILQKEKRGRGCDTACSPIPTGGGIVLLYLPPQAEEYGILFTQLQDL
jgi:hypothetical protein